jgi:hypothetical protein
MNMMVRGAVGAMMVAGALAGGPALAQQVLSAASSEANPNGTAVQQLSSTAGATVTTGTAPQLSRAQSDYGINKVFASSSGGFDQYATSFWRDSYTVGGTGPVNVALSFAFDGSATLPAGSSGIYNFKLFALRGENYVATGRAPQTFNTPFDAKLAGTQYDSLLLTTSSATLVSQIDLREYDGVYNYTNNAGSPGTFQNRVNYFEAGDYYEARNAVQTIRWYVDRREITTGTQQPSVTFYTPQNGLANVRNAFVQNFIVLDRASLCNETLRGCTTDFSGTTTLSLNFTVAAGSTFSLASYLYADDLDQGSIDFFNTARLNAITVSPGASLTSRSGALQALPGGGLGYISAPTGSVPEPASWAMLITGFGLVGGLRRRNRQTAIQQPQKGC